VAPAPSQPAGNRLRGAKHLGVCCGKLAEFGLEVHRGLGGTGVVGVLRGEGANRAIGLRADMDALNIHEANSFEYRSTKPGKMHACGHDEL
jgi:hippurate hydrolase